MNSIIMVSKEVVLEIQAGLMESWVSAYVALLNKQKSSMVNGLKTENILTLRLDRTAT